MGQNHREHCENAASCVKSAQLERTQRDMGRAAQQRQMAEQQADAARRAAGLSTTTSSLNTWP